MNVYENGEWTAVASLPLARSHNHTATFIVNGKIVIAGGQANGGTAPITIDNLSAYDPAEDRWFDLPPLPGPRQACVAQLLGNDIIVTTGSSAGVNPQTSTWTLDAGVVP